MFVNLSNHNSKLWNSEQRREAEKYGEIMDYDFPQVNPNFTESEIKDIAEK